MTFLLGLFIGASIGFLAAAMFHAGAQADQRS
jgi:gas vesicle protein